MTLLTCPPRSLAGSVTVACLGVSEDARRGLRKRLGGIADERWNVVGATDHPAGARVDLVLCGAPSASTAAVRQWPAAAIIVLVDARDDGAAVVGALDTGAATCVRGNDLDLVAAYLRALVRRRGLLAVAHDVSRDAQQDVQR